MSAETDIFEDGDNRWDNRTLRLIGSEGVEALRGARVMVAGLGGVGGYAAEMLARSGVGELTLIDADTVAPSNLNRQLIALRSTLGKPKALLFAERFHDINPEARIHSLVQYIDSDNVATLIEEAKPDFVVDAIDTVAPKVRLIQYCQTHSIRIISSMGAGGRIDPTRIIYTDLWETRDDGLAKAVRTGLRKLGPKMPLPVVASTERPRSHSLTMIDNTLNKRSSYGTLATIPSIFGIMLASHVICTLTNLQ